MDKPEMTDEEFAELASQLEEAYRRYHALNKIFEAQTGKAWRPQLYI